MSRIAKYPIPLPKGVDLTLASGSISVKGPLGIIERPADPNVEVKKDGFPSWPLLAKGTGFVTPLSRTP